MNWRFCKATYTIRCWIDSLFVDVDRLALLASKAIRSHDRVDSVGRSIVCFHWALCRWTYISNSGYGAARCAIDLCPRSFLKESTIDVFFCKLLLFAVCRFSNISVWMSINLLRKPYCFLDSLIKLRLQMNLSKLSKISEISSILKASTSFQGKRINVPHARWR